MPRTYLRITIDWVDGPDPGGSYTDFEGMVDSEEVLEAARTIWGNAPPMHRRPGTLPNAGDVTYVESDPEDDPELWALWLHYVHEYLDQGDACWQVPANLNAMTEVFVALCKFLGRERGVFLLPDGGAP